MASKINGAVSSKSYARIKEEWTKDKELQAIISKLQQGSTSVKHYSWTANQLLRKRKFMIGKDNDLKQALLRHFHSEGQGGHSGVQATLKRIAAYVYWKKIRKEVKIFVRNCNVCQIFKPELFPHPGLLQPLPIPNQIWTKISIDFVDSLPMSKGKSVIMMVVDRLSKTCHFIPLSHPYTAITVAQAFLDNIYKLHGLPKIIFSDKDTVFLSRFWKELDRLKEWANWIALAEYWYNTSYHTAINNTPFQVVFGQPPPTHITYSHGESPLETIDRLLVAREAAIDLLKFHLQRAQNRMKMADDKRISGREFVPLELMLSKRSRKNTKCVNDADEELTAAKHKLMLLVYCC
nr:retrotransposable element Tf2 [Tanacetum cinerariifolium]